MKFKRVIFWSHLVAGVTAGVIIFLLSLTGVLLMYERQIIALAESSFDVNPQPTQSRLSADALLESAENAKGSGVSLVFQNDPVAPVTIRKGRGDAWLMDPYTGAVIGEGAITTKAVFGWLTSFHRWFALKGGSRDTARALINAANLVFLFIVLSGLYLWLPRIWKWVFIQKNLLFTRSYPNAKARDYHWHHVFGIWALIPLFFIIITGAVFYYSWANNLVYATFGEQPPRGRGGPEPEFNINVDETRMISLQKALETAQAFDADWNRITLSSTAPVAKFSVDTGTGGQPTRITQLYVSRADGEILQTAGFSDSSPGRQARFYIRFLHTGEALGFIGQTVFGLASLAACFLVYTGLALAYRRLLQPVFRRKRAAVGLNI